eukprot:TRINITY_DN15729_c0_g1_i1.p2 TRINITY_DN15729_c0_g1~~TRINITY_DN15729_c0_g1_i1.p2  ORF type:complete len:355 (+),score=103.96 TRINITY_DN15729_c0_g1_i1:155-1219(+)
MGGVSIDCSNEALDRYGNAIQKFLKVMVLAGCALSMAAWLAMIYTTIAPSVEVYESLKTHDDLKNDDKPDYLVPIEGGAVHMASKDDPKPPPGTDAAWVTYFKVMPDWGEKKCYELGSGVEMTCENEPGGEAAGAILVSKPPTDGDLWPTWRCVKCMYFCTACPVNTISQCAEDDRVNGCLCKPGCNCMSDHMDPEQSAYQFWCTNAPARTLGAVRGGLLSGEFKFFAVLSEVAYLFASLGLVLSELEISKFLHYFSFFNKWVPRMLAHLFVGVQLINTSSALDQAKANSGFSHFLALMAGWIMVFCALVQLWFRTVFAIPARPCKMMGMCFIVATAVMVVIGAIMGTTADKDE